MQLPTASKWQGVEHIYTLPWIRNRVALTADPALISQYAKKKFTRSQVLIDLLRQYHLSSDSILVSSDEHSAFLRAALAREFPPSSEYKHIARDLVERLFVPSENAEETHSLRLSGNCVQKMYVTILQSILGVRILPPLQKFIDETDFSPGSRSLRLEALMYSLGMHSPMFAPVRIALDVVFFRQAWRMRKISKKLEKEVYNFSQAEPDSWFETLQSLLISRKISRKQFYGEITSMLVSSFSMASLLSFSLLCLAARPKYIEMINQNPTFAGHFLSEVLRLYPPFHQFGYQRCPHAKDDMDAKGSGRRKGPTDFLVSAYYLHRNPDAWLYASQFWPERFLDRSQSNKFRYLPFGLGKRSCPGRVFSIRLITEVLKHICSDASHVTLVPSDGLPQGSNDRLISFPIDDHIQFKSKVS